MDPKPETIEHLRGQMAGLVRKEMQAQHEFQKAPGLTTARQVQEAEEQVDEMRKRITAHPDYRVEGL